MTNKKERKQIKFELQDLLQVSLLFIVVGIGISYGANVVSDVQSGFTTNTQAYNVTADTLTGLGKLSSKLPTLATIVVAAIILGVLVNLMVRRFM